MVSLPKRRTLGLSGLDSQMLARFDMREQAGYRGRGDPLFDNPSGPA